MYLSHLFFVIVIQRSFTSYQHPYPHGQKYVAPVVICCAAPVGPAPSYPTIHGGYGHMKVVKSVATQSSYSYTYEVGGPVSYPAQQTQSCCADP
ncbi:hypothetical protein RB195_016312 [Necator americanus]|uniref:Uncharacterized protein n=1 Tax=Necator americanus TaxID=51031 RepID=A0ABR1E8P6_NECAM